MNEGKKTMTRNTAKGLIALMSLTTQCTVLSIVYGWRTGLGALAISIGIGVAFELVGQLGKDAA